LAVVRCGGCTTVCHTGGEPEVKAMASQPVPDNFYEKIKPRLHKRIG